MTEVECRVAWVEALRLAEAVMRQAAGGEPVDRELAGGLAERVIAVGAWQAAQAAEGDDNDDG